ncbi:lipopolysaccharide transport periplasmic protein LptA [Dyella sp.]|uniref:lipopolysaccharide transport periplasmic protein LptA n=1 Tax=Dyella sp. TaxID=1869338 RepID=UPI002ED23A6B
MTSTAPSSRARGIARYSLLVLALAALQPAQARKDDRDQPMNVERANSFDGVNAPNSVSTLKGNVVITQGTMKVTGDLAKIYFDGDQNVSRVVMTGKPAHIQQIDDSGNLMTGDAAQLDYDNINGIAVLTDHAVVKQQGRGEAHGDKLTYNTNTSQMTGESGSDGRVAMTFLPKPRTAKGGAAPAKPGSAAAPTAPAPAHTAPAKPQGQP